MRFKQPGLAEFTQTADVKWKFGLPWWKLEMSGDDHYTRGDWPPPTTLPHVDIDAGSPTFLSPTRQHEIHVESNLGRRPLGVDFNASTLHTLFFRYLFIHQATLPLPRNNFQLPSSRCGRLRRPTVVDRVTHLAPRSSSVKAPTPPQAPTKRAAFVAFPTIISALLSLPDAAPICLRFQRAQHYAGVYAFSRSADDSSGVTGFSYGFPCGTLGRKQSRKMQQVLALAVQCLLRPGPHLSKFAAIELGRAACCAPRSDLADIIEVLARESATAQLKHPSSYGSNLWRHGDDAEAPP
ncbi:hypothetical protein C8R46DRAFT_1193123 [Mycena filopes]|nr:hypothetical protein C8R46DRAFT_1193123 [Mycena filopes]